MPTEQILTLEQVDAFEEEMRRQFITSHQGLMLNLSMLCQTVRAAWAKVVEETERADENFIAYDRVKGKYSETVNRLSEVTKERDRWREQTRENRRVVTHWQKHATRMANILKCESMDTSIEQATERLVKERDDLRAELEKIKGAGVP